MADERVGIKFIGDWHPAGREAIVRHLSGLPPSDVRAWTFRKDHPLPRPIYALRDGWEENEGYASPNVRDLLDFLTHYHTTGPTQ
jgi:hypothetical protein